MMNKLNKFFKPICIAASILAVATTLMSASAITVKLIESDYGSYKTYTVRYSSIYKVEGEVELEYKVTPTTPPNLSGYPQQFYPVPVFQNMPGYPQQAYIMPPSQNVTKVSPQSYTINVEHTVRCWDEIDGVEVKNYTEAKQAIFRHFSKAIRHLPRTGGDPIDNVK